MLTNTKSNQNQIRVENQVGRSLSPVVAIITAAVVLLADDDAVRYHGLVTAAIKKRAKVSDVRSTWSRCRHREERWCTLRRCSRTTGYEPPPPPPRNSRRERRDDEKERRKKSSLTPTTRFCPDLLLPRLSSPSPLLAACVYIKNQKTYMVAHASRTLVALAVMLVVALYVRDYLRAGLPRHGRERYVVQVSADRFDPELLLERQPIVVEDRVFDVAQLAADVMRWQRLYTRVCRDVILAPVDEHGRVCRRNDAARHHRHRHHRRALETLARATFVTPSPSRRQRQLQLPPDEKVMLAARPVDAAAEEEIAFRLRPGQVLVLPAHWSVRWVFSFSDEEQEQQQWEENLLAIDIVEVFDLVHLAMWGPMRALHPYGYGHVPPSRPPLHPSRRPTTRTTRTRTKG